MAPKLFSSDFKASRLLFCTPLRQRAVTRAQKLCDTPPYPPALDPQASPSHFIICPLQPGSLETRLIKPVPPLLCIADQTASAFHRVPTPPSPLCLAVATITWLILIAIHQSCMISMRRLRVCAGFARNCHWASGKGYARLLSNGQLKQPKISLPDPPSKTNYSVLSNVKLLIVKCNRDLVTFNSLQCFRHVTLHHSSIIY